MALHRNNGELFLSTKNVPDRLLKVLSVSSKIDSGLAILPSQKNYQDHCLPPAFQQKKSLVFDHYPIEADELKKLDSQKYLFYSLFRDQKEHIFLVSKIDSNAHL